MAEHTAAASAAAVSAGKITTAHRRRDAYIYVRQSTLAQVTRNTESLARQYDLRERAGMLGWPAAQIVVVDEDLGRSGASAAGRKGFADLVADVGLGKAGIVLTLEVSRLARNNADWLIDRTTAACRRCRLTCVDEIFGTRSVASSARLSRSATGSDRLARRER